MASAPTVVGVWRLSRWGRMRDDGPIMPFEGARGRLIYQASGIMSAHLKRASLGTLGARRLYAYSGRWRMEGDTAFHEVDFADIAEWVGATLTRTVRLLDAERLHLETPPVAARGGGLRDLLEWTRDA